MKILSYIAIIIALIGFGIGVYCQIEIVPNCEGYGRAAMHYHDQKMLFGSISLFVGFLSLILGAFAGIKKQKIGWVAAALGFIAVILGLLQSTHMFS